MRILQKQLDNMKTWMESREDIPQGWVYIGNEKERYILGQPGSDNVFVFGVNPSTAIPEKDDQTIRRVRKIAEHDGYDGWLMVNLYPMISSDPKKLPADPDKRLVDMNLQILLAAAAAYPIRTIWAAWGDTIDTRIYLYENLLAIQDQLPSRMEWFYRGEMTKQGNPRHPLYMKKDEKFSWLPVFDYTTSRLPINGLY